MEFKVTHHQIRHMLPKRWGPRVVLNLRSDAYTNMKYTSEEISSKTYDSGWTLTGFNSYEVGKFCHTFEAEHHVHGKILGSLQNPDCRADRELDFVVMSAKHERAFQDFWRHHGMCVEVTKDTINYDTDSEDE